MSPNALQLEAGRAFHAAAQQDSRERGWETTSNAIAARLGIGAASYSEGRRGRATLTRIALWCQRWHESGGSRFALVTDGTTVSVRWHPGA